MERILTLEDLKECGLDIYDLNYLFEKGILVQSSEK